MNLKLSSVGSYLLSAILFLAAPTLQAQSQDLIDSYVNRWTDLYPSAAFGQGQKSAAWRFEDFSEQRVSDWLEFNRRAEQLLALTPRSAPLGDRVDSQVLLRQVRLELELWEQDKVLTQQPQWYTKQISEALTYVLISEKLTAAEKYAAVLTRLKGIRSLCKLGIRNLGDGNPARIQGALKALASTADFYENELLAQSDAWTENAGRNDFGNEVRMTTQQMRELARHISDQVLPVASVPSNFGPEVYARKLVIFSDNSLTPETLSEIALLEIDRVRCLARNRTTATRQPLRTQ